MKTGIFFGMSVVASFLAAVGLPAALGIFFRGFLKKSNPNIPAFMAAVVLFGVQQFIVYRGDQRIAQTVLPRVQSMLPESLRYDMWLVPVIFILLLTAGVGIPFIFARLGITVSDWIDEKVQKMKDFIGRFLPRKQ